MSKTRTNQHEGLTVGPIVPELETGAPQADPERKKTGDGLAATLATHLREKFEKPDQVTQTATGTAILEANWGRLKRGDRYVYTIPDPKAPESTLRPKIVFAGGAREPKDPTPLGAFLREAEEEIRERFTILNQDYHLLTPDERRIMAQADAVKEEITELFGSLRDRYSQVLRFYTLALPVNRRKDKAIKDSFHMASTRLSPNTIEFLQPYLLKLPPLPFSVPLVPDLGLDNIPTNQTSSKTPAPDSTESRPTLLQTTVRRILDLDEPQSPDFPDSTEVKPALLQTVVTAIYRSSTYTLPDGHAARRIQQIADPNYTPPEELDTGPGPYPPTHTQLKELTEQNPIAAPFWQGLQETAQALVKQIESYTQQYNQFIKNWGQVIASFYPPSDEEPDWTIEPVPQEKQKAILQLADQLTTIQLLHRELDKYLCLIQFATVLEELKDHLAPRPLNVEQLSPQEQNHAIRHHKQLKYPADIVTLAMLTIMSRQEISNQGLPPLYASYLPNGEIIVATLLPTQGAEDKPPVSQPIPVIVHIKPIGSASSNIASKRTEPEIGLYPISFKAWEEIESATSQPNRAQK